MTFEELTPPYSAIVADPPWAYEDGFVQWHTGAGRTERPLPYSSMSVDDICGLPVASLAARDCWLFLWTTNRYLFHVPSVLLDWGFSYRQTLVWHKTGNPSPFGGSVAPNHAEYLIVAAKGSPKVLGRLSSSVVQARKPHASHSRKPEAFMDAIEQCVKGPYVELFSRQPRFGWDSWGHGYESAVPA